MQTGQHRDLIIVGLGPGTWESLTVQAASILQSAVDVYVRTSVQPSIQSIQSHVPNVHFHSFDYLYDSQSSLEDIYSQITEEIARLVREHERVVYAVPGSPALGETTVRLLLEHFASTEVDVKVVQGLSFAESMLTAVGISDAGWIEVFDAGEIALMAEESPLGELSGQKVPQPWRAPVTTSSLLISPLFDRTMAAYVKLWLGKYYPDEHGVQLVQSPGTSAQRVESIQIFELDRIEDIDHATTLYVPPISENENARTFAGLMQVTRRLRGPGGCPWDREQTSLTLKPYLLEEAYEVLDALDSEDPQLLSEELGDLLFQIAIHSQVAAESGAFTIEDVLQNIVCKMIGRHPHVFADLQLETAHDVRQAWEGFKQREKPARVSVLEEIPRGLPALPRSNLMQKRVASVGFDWPDANRVMDKVDEELQELRRAIDSDLPKDRQREEFGDLLFALVSVARHLRIDPEEALRLANRKFAGRFHYVESRAASLNKALRDMNAEELDRYWNEAKLQPSVGEA
ncbi:MAG: nucleoside triphosphate pyrophosphohydrolase [Chloroflexota bacterium]